MPPGRAMPVGGSLWPGRDRSSVRTFAAGIVCRGHRRSFLCSPLCGVVCQRQSGRNDAVRVGSGIVRSSDRTVGRRAGADRSDRRAGPPGRRGWLVAVVGGSAVGDALDDRSRAVQIDGHGRRRGSASAVGAGALAVAGVVTLTLARTIVPGCAGRCRRRARRRGRPWRSALLLVVPAAIAATARRVRRVRPGVHPGVGVRRRGTVRPASADRLPHGVRRHPGCVTAVAVVVAPVAWAAACLDRRRPARRSSRSLGCTLLPVVGTSSRAAGS